MSKIEAVIFDMDGLMFDTEGLISQTLKEMLAEVGVKNIPNWDKFARTYLCGNRPDKKIENLENILNIHLDWQDFEVKVVARYYSKIQAMDKVSTKPGLIELLNYLKREKIKTAVASSSSKTGNLIKLVCEKAGIALDYFDCIVGGEEAKESKPSPQIWQLACQKIGVNPENSIALDDCDFGILSAKNANMIPILIPDRKINDENMEKLAFRKVKTLHEVIGILRELK